MRIILRSLGVLVMLMSLAACGSTTTRNLLAEGATDTVISENQSPSKEVGVFRTGVFHWKNVGGDSCNPSVGCTLTWALYRSRWPAEVQQLLTNAVRTKKPIETSMTSGWRGWMTWGQSSRKFHANVVADWPTGQSESAHEWQVGHRGVVYVLVRVKKCHNWGGYTRGGSAYLQSAGATPQVSCS